MGELEERLILRNADWAQMKLHVRSAAPEEACGLVVGKDNRSHLVFEVENLLHSPIKFLMEAQEQVRVFSKMEELGYELLAIYHSHPNGPAHPSTTDLDEHAYPEAVALIWYREVGEWNCRGFRLSGGGYSPVLVQIESNSRAAGSLD